MAGKRGPGGRREPPPHAHPARRRRAAGALPLSAPAPARAVDGDTIVKPLPPEAFVRHGTNAETRWEALRGTGHHTPNDLFFVRNHTATPAHRRRRLAAAAVGSGLRGGPGEDRAVEFGYDDLRRLPSVTRTAFVECALSNGRSGLHHPAGRDGLRHPWTLGAIGVARWRGVPWPPSCAGRACPRTPSTCSRAAWTPSTSAAGRTSAACGGRCRFTKALDDVVLAYEMNGEPLPPDHGYPVRVLVPSWVGIASIKWVGDIEVSAQPLFSPWNTAFYRLFGPAHPEGGTVPLTRQTLKSAFELASGATFPAGRRQVLTGRSWSGAGPVARVDVSTDGGSSWRPSPAAGTTASRHVDPVVRHLEAPHPGHDPAAGPRHRHGGPHPAGRLRLQHPGLPVRRRGAARGDGDLTRAGPLPGPGPALTW